MNKVKQAQKVFVVVLAAAALTASAALATPLKTHPDKSTHPDTSTHPGKGHKPPTSGLGCKPQIMVVLRGTVATAPGANPTLPYNLMVTVKSANRHGRAYVKANQPTTVTVTASTRIVRHGKAKLSDLQQGDRVLVQARVCKADLAKGATPGLTARKIVAHPVPTTGATGPTGPTGPTGATGPTGYDLQSSKNS